MHYREDNSVLSLISDFPRFLQVFEKDPPFKKTGQLENHLDTIRLRRELGSATNAINNDEFLSSLYKTLQAWGIGARASNLNPFPAFASAIRARGSEIAHLEGLSIDNPNLDVDATGKYLWGLIDTLDTVSNYARAVPNSKALHHLLPELVVPIDRAYTQRFFGWQNPTFQYQQAECFQYAFAAFADIARKADPNQYINNGWNSSRTKVIDNAIVGKVLDEEIEVERSEETNNSRVATSESANRGSTNGSHLSPSGVRIAGNFRDNLIIDRYDPVFADMRASKIMHLRSENSEDVFTWNVFRSLRQIAPEVWIPSLWEQAFPLPCPANLKAIVKLWESMPPPLGLLESGDEGPSEIDVVIEAADWVWFIEAKYRSDISLSATMRPTRDQILRNIDVGSYYAGARDFYFSLLISSEKSSPEGANRIAEYKDLSVPRTKLQSHRPDGLQNLKAVSRLTWTALAQVLATAAVAAHREDEGKYALRAAYWLRKRGFA